MEVLKSIAGWVVAFLVSDGIVWLIMKKRQRERAGLDTGLACSRTLMGGCARERKKPCRLRHVIRRGIGGVPDVEEKVMGEVMGYGPFVPSNITRFH